MSSDAAVREAVRKAQVEEAFWRFFTTYRLQLADCTANQNMLEAALEDQTLPITFESLSKVWESLTTEQKFVYARPTTGEIKPRREAAGSGTVVKTEEVLEKLNILPDEWTARTLQKADRDTFKALYKKYGREAIDDRLAGRS